MKKNPNCCCIINNGKRIFNYVENEIVPLINYYLNDKEAFDMSYAKKLERNIIFNIRTYCISDMEFLSTHYQNFNYWTIKYNDKYFYFDGKKVNYSDYPAFFVKIQEDYQLIGSYYKEVNMGSTISTLIKTVKPYIEKMGINIENTSFEPCYLHAHLYSDNKKIFELLFNTEYNGETWIWFNDEEYLDNFEFTFFEW